MESLAFSGGALVPHLWALSLAVCFCYYPEVPLELRLGTTARRPWKFQQVKLQRKRPDGWFSDHGQGLATTSALA
jgi:hypothetical protein